MQPTQNDQNAAPGIDAEQTDVTAADSTASEPAAVGDAEADELLAQLTASARARASIYRMLASLYRKELDAQEIAGLAEALRDGIPAVDNPVMAQGYRDIAAYLNGDTAAMRLDLAVDFACAILAAGSYDERRATPYESVFTSESGLLMQEARDDVYRLMCEAHLGVREELREPEDHLGFECEFMAKLADRQADALERRDLEEAAATLRVQTQMHANHLLNWIDDYCDCLEKVAKTVFYRGVAKLTRGFVHDERDFIADSAAAVEELRAAGTRAGETCTDRAAAN